VAHDFDQGGCVKFFGDRSGFSTLGVAFTLSMFFFPVGCAGPMGMIPGGALEGPETSLTAAKFSADVFADEGGVIQLETRPADPYSVNLGARKIGGHVYVDPTEARAWYQHIQADDRVRIRFAGSDAIYAARAIAEEDASVVSQFTADRRVLRIEPRSN